VVGVDLARALGHVEGFEVGDGAIQPGFDLPQGLSHGVGIRLGGDLAGHVPRLVGGEVARLLDPLGVLLALTLSAPGGAGEDSRRQENQ